MLLVNLALLAGAFLFVRRTDSLPEVRIWSAILLMLASCASLGWLIYRGTQYRLLAVARGLGRASWILLDLISLIAIFSAAFLTPLELEWRMRTLLSKEEFIEDCILLGCNRAAFGGASDARCPIVFMIYNQIVLYEISAPYGEIGDKYVTRKSIGSIETRVLGRYAPGVALLAQQSGNVDRLAAPGAAILAFKEAFKNFRSLWYAHFGNPYLPDFDGERGFVWLFSLGMVQALVLWVASLPAVTGKGLLGAFGVIVGGGILMSILATAGVPSVVNWLTLVIFIGAALLLAVFGLLRNRTTFVIRSAFGFALLTLPLAGWLVWLWSDDNRSQGYNPIYGFTILAANFLSIPGYQYCINRLHAAPD
jgi:hypothetical protein